MQILEIILILAVGLILTIIYKYQKNKRLRSEVIRSEYRNNVEKLKQDIRQTEDLRPISDEETEMYDNSISLIMWKSLVHTGKRTFNDHDDLFSHNAFIQIIRNSNNIFLMRIIADMNGNQPISSSKWYIIQREDGVTVKDYILKIINSEFKSEGKIMEDVEFNYTAFEKHIESWFVSEYDHRNDVMEFATVLGYTTRDILTERTQLNIGVINDSITDTKVLDLNIRFKTMYDRSMRKAVTEFSSGNAKAYFDYGLDNIYRPEGRLTLGVHLQDAVDKFIYSALISSGISDIDEFDVDYTILPSTTLNLVCEHILVAIRESKSDIETVSASFRIVVTRKDKTAHA